MNPPRENDTRIERKGSVLIVWRYRTFGDPDHGGYWQEAGRAFHGDEPLARAMARHINPNAEPTILPESPVMSLRQAS